MKTKFNDEQISIINEGIDHNILVSAAAGSGKTTVLVERIVRKLMGENCNDENISLSNILIMTFTKKATAEMKKRIKKAIDDKLIENPSDKKLIRESAIMQNANISTIDSFCMRVFEENYVSLDEKNSLYYGVDNDCKIVDEKELSIMQDDVLNILLESEYNENTYKSLFDAYTEKTSERNLRDILNAGIGFLNSIAWPIDYIDRQIKYFDKYSKDAFDEYVKNESYELQRLIKSAEKYLPIVLKYKNICEDALAACEEKKKENKSTDKIRNIINNLSEVISFLEKTFDGEYVQEVKDNGKISYNISENEFKKLKDLASSVLTLNLSFPIVTSLGIDKEENEYYKTIIKEEVVSIAKNICNIYEYINIDKRFLINENEKLYLHLLKKYYISIIEEKKKRNMFEIGDYAKMTLDILYDKVIDENGDAKRVMSDVAKSFSDKYKLVFIDEYQDTSELQEHILRALSNDFKKNNVFMVGDVKQSIYEFRDAEPQIFVDKYKLFDSDEGTGVVKTLNTNYRSTKEIIGYVNDLFGKVMTKEFGEIDYSDRHALSVKDEEINKETTDDTKVEIKVVCESEDDNDSNEKKEDKVDKLEKVEKIDFEAEYVARKIYELVEIKKECDYKDIVILLRTAKGKTEKFANAFNKYKVPYYAEQKQGFFGRLEIKLMIDLLNIIYNPMQNIPLVSVLESNIFRFNNEEIAAIKLLYDPNNELSNYMFYDALQHARSIQKNDDAIKQLKKYKLDSKEFYNKINFFFEKIDSLEFSSRYLSISDLIEKIYTELNVKDIMSALNEGRQRLANLNMLYNFAIAYEKSSYVGLFNFLRYIEKITETDGDKGQAKIFDENANVVRMMTIHTSKGLQFKTVFMCDCNKGYNTKDAKDTNLVLFNKKYGVALDYYDFVDRYKVITPKKKMFAIDKLNHIKLEETRMLYVALTRPEQKLYIVGHTAGQGFTEKSLQEFLNAKAEKTNIDKDLRQYNSFFDIILTNYPVNDEENCSFEVVPISMEANTDNIEEDFDLDEFRKSLKNDLVDIKNEDFEKLDTDIIKNDLEDKYLFKDLQKLTPKFSVSSIKKEHRDNLKNQHIESVVASNDSTYDDNIDYDTKQIDKTNDNMDMVDGRDIGNAYHRYMQFYDYKTMQYVNKSENYDIENLNKLIEKSKIDNFLKSNIGKRMSTAFNSDSLYREYKFMNLLSQSEIDKYIGKGNANSSNLPDYIANDENIVVQGIIDAFLVEKDENNNDYIVLVDYKTDSLGKKTINKEKLREDLIGNYKVQLDIYAKAIERNTGYEVREKCIYSFALDEEIKL